MAALPKIPNCNTAVRHPNQMYCCQMFPEQSLRYSHQSTFRACKQDTQMDRSMVPSPCKGTYQSHLGNVQVILIRASASCIQWTMELQWQPPLGLPQRLHQYESGLSHLFEFRIHLHEIRQMISLRVTKHGRPRPSR